VPALVESATRVGPYLAVIQDAGELGSADDLRSLVSSVRERLGADPSVTAIAARVGGKPSIVIATSPAARELGAKAGALVRQAATVLGGGGGGKDDMAQGGGTDVAAIGSALDGVTAALRG
jgi:alanyl-tRNA synthetase